MALTREEVRHVAMLARLALTPGEEEALAGHLAQILAYIETLKGLDTGGVEPTAHVVEMSSLFREDRVSNAPRTDELLSNAPNRDGDFFKVPKIIE